MSMRECGDSFRLPNRLHALHTNYRHVWHMLRLNYAAHFYQSTMARCCYEPTREFGLCIHYG